MLKKKVCFLMLNAVAWNDGKIRLFTPESGSLMLTIPNAHSMGVTALASASDCRHLVSGGGEGQVRLIKLIEPFSIS